MFKNVDFVISSSAFGKASLKNKLEKKDISLIWIFAHLHTVSLLFLKKNKLPRDLQITSKKYEDYKLFGFLDILKKKFIKDVDVVNNY